MAYSDALEELGRRRGLEGVIEGIDMEPVSDLKTQARGEMEFALGVVAALTGKSRREVMLDLENL